MKESCIMVNAETFDPCKTLECGQVFRYQKLDDNDYIVYALNNCCRVTRKGDVTQLSTDEMDFFKNYFDLSTCYEDILTRLSCFEEMKDTSAFGKGIRILRQDLLETLISFIISANNNIPRIKGILQRLCAMSGEQKNGYYGFPSLISLQQLSEKQFKDIGCGFRANYLFETCKMLSNKELERLKALQGDDITKNLLRFRGVGKKVADCISLFSFHKMDSYPVDTWIFKANQSDALNSPQKVNEYYVNRYGMDAGYAQQLLFYYQREAKI